MNHYPLQAEEQTNERQVRELVTAIFDDYGDGLSSHKTMGGVEQIMNCVVMPLLRRLAPPAPVAEQREYRIVGKFAKEGSAPALHITTDETVVKNVLAILNAANPVYGFKEQWRTPAGPWVDADTKGED